MGFYCFSIHLFFGSLLKNFRLFDN